MDDQAVMWLTIISAGAGVVSWILRNRTSLPDQLVTDVTGAVVATAAYFAPGLGVQFMLGALGLAVARRVEKTGSHVLPGPGKSATYK